MRKYLAPVVGVAAFVIGGILAREHALDGLDTLERLYDDKFGKSSEDEPEEIEVPVVL